MRTFLYLLPFFFFASLLKAQVPDAHIVQAQQTNIHGVFFIAPYKANATSPKTALLNKVMILNTKGEVLYYRTVSIGNDFKLQSNGMITVWNGTKWLLLNHQLNVTDSVACVNGVETDSHDFMVLPNGHYLLIGKMVETEDFSTKRYFNQLHPVAGSKHAKVKYDVIQELDKNKKLVYEWNSKEHFKLEDADRFYLKDSAIIDVTHFNSIDEDESGNLLISARFYNEVLKVNKKTGKIIWRMGGKYNTIKVLNDSLPFLGQHDAKFTGKSSFSLFDNGHSYDSLKHSARVLEYEIDDGSKTARVIDHYSNPGKLYSQAAGNVQRIKNKYTLINYGKLSPDSKNITLEMLDSAGKNMLTLAYPDTLASYRAYYYEKCPIAIEQPELKVIQKNGIDYMTTGKAYKHYLWNNGKTDKEIEFVKGKPYYVFLSNDGAVFIRSKTK